MRVTLGNNELNNGRTYKLSAFDKVDEPIVHFDNDPSKRYTIMMIDVNADNYIHLLVINNTQSIADYKPPSPPKGTHKYVIYIIEQKSFIEPFSLSTRRPFDISKMTRKGAVVDTFTFNVSA